MAQCEKKCNICGIRIPEGEEREAMFGEIMVDNFLKLMKHIDSNTQEVPYNSSRISPKHHSQTAENQRQSKTF